MQLQENLKKHIKLCAICTCIIIIVACNRRELFQDNDYKQYTIAVVLPYSSDMETQWHRAIDWALINVNRSLEKHQIKVTTQWYNEDEQNIAALFDQLSKRSDICGIIGPLYSANVGIAAIECIASNKPIIPAASSSEQLMRAFANYNILWFLTENDISQCELLLSTAISKGAKSVSLLTNDGLYGQTFLDWFAFQAKEMGLKVNSVVSYNKYDLDQKMKMLMAENSDCLICIPTDDNIVQRMNNLRNKYPPQHSFLLFSDVAFFSTPNKTFNNMEGIAQIYNPYSTFDTQYNNRYEKNPSYASAQFYDAAMLLGLSIFYSNVAAEDDLNQCMRHIVSGQTGSADWTANGIETAVQNIANGTHIAISGASGNLQFDNTLFTNVLHSYYCHWQIIDGKRVIVGYTNSDNKQRLDSSATNWHWDISDWQQDFQTTQFHYPKLQNLNVLIVATSNGWQNYRHQADALSLYQLLKHNGVTDKQIMLIIEDDLAFNSKNPYQGVVQTSPTGQNLYQNVDIDYQPSTLQSSDLLAIISGSSTSNVQQTIQSDSTCNLLVYWVGHGSSNGYLGFNDELLPMETLADYFRTVASQKRYRKIFIAMESCYAGIFGNHCKGIPGLMCITATADKETSKARNFNAILGVWMSDCFSANLVDCFAQNESISIYDLYCNIYKTTIGSHVSVYNSDYFDNLYMSSAGEFLRVNPQ